MVSPIELAFCISLVKRGIDTVERVRELIAVSSDQEAELRRILAPEVVARVLSDRSEILRAFNRAIAEIERPRNTKPRRLSADVRFRETHFSRAGSASRAL